MRVRVARVLLLLAPRTATSACTQANGCCKRHPAACARNAAPVSPATTENPSDHASPFRDYVAAAARYAAGEKQRKPVSGKGSAPAAQKPFIAFLEEWLRTQSVRSMVEASCGHWPSGWQLSVNWPPGLNYTGADILPSMVQANSALPRGDKMSARTFVVMDMMEQALPRADLLLTKDTLIHFPNSGIGKFLALSVNACPPRFRYVMFVHDIASDETERQVKLPDCKPYASPTRCRWRNNRDTHLGGFHTLDLGAPPFNLPIRTVLTYGRTVSGNTRTVQLLNLTRAC